MDVFDEARRAEAEMLDALRAMDEEEGFRSDSQSIGENMRIARELANSASGKVKRALG